MTTSKEMSTALSAIYNLNSEEELIALNRTVCDRLKTIRARQAHVVKASLNEGDEVTWTGRKGTQRGSVTKVMRKFARVSTSGGTWRVPMNMLRKV